MEYIIGAAIGALIFASGLLLGLGCQRVNHTSDQGAKPPTEEPSETKKASEEEMLRIKREEELQRQWENMCNYNGKPQVKKHED